MDVRLLVLAQPLGIPFLTSDVYHLQEFASMDFGIVNYESKLKLNIVKISSCNKLVATNIESHLSNTYAYQEVTHH